MYVFVSVLQIPSGGVADFFCEVSGEPAPSLTYHHIITCMCLFPCYRFRPAAWLTLSVRSLVSPAIADLSSYYYMYVFVSVLQIPSGGVADFFCEVSGEPAPSLTYHHIITCMCLFPCYRFHLAAWLTFSVRCRVSPRHR